MVVSYQQEHLHFYRRDILACLLALLECIREAGASTAAFDCASGPEGAGAEGCVTEEVDEAELMRVSLLQGPVKFGLRPRGRWAVEPHVEASDAGWRSAAVYAEGLVDAAPALAPAATGVAGARRGPSHGAVLQTAVDASPWPLAAGTENEAAEDGTEFLASLVQTDLKPDEPADGSSPQHPATARPEQEAPAELGLGAPCTPGPTTLSMYIQLETLRAIGTLPQSALCMPERGHRAISLSQQEFVQTFPVKELSSKTLERMTIIGYVAFYLICTCYMWYAMVYPSKLGERTVQYHLGQKVVTEIDVEEETWRHSWIGWLGCSWCSAWVARWGQSFDAALTKIRADELPQLGGREFQAFECAGLFKKLWQEQNGTDGLEKASIFGVIVSIWSMRSMLALLLITACQQIVMQLYAVLIMEHGLRYFFWLQQERLTHPGKDIPLAIPLLVSICAFSAMPLVNCVFNSISINIARKLDQRLSGAMCIAVFEKAQRLPSSCLHPTIYKDEETGKQKERPPEVDVMQLIGFDINTNIMGSYFQLCFCVNSFFACIVFTTMLWSRLKLATLVAFGLSIPVIGLLACLAARMTKHGFELQSVQDQRIRTLRELLWGIRVVKSYAWEDAVEARVTKYRDQEMGILETYWYYIGAIMGVVMAFPRVLIISALWAFSEMYGTHDVANIWVCMQLLAFVKVGCEGLAISLARVILMRPSLQRIESFLKMEEAPVLLPERRPDWVDMWPSASGGGGAGPGGGDPEQPPPSLTLRGTFAWTEGGEPVLRDVDLDVKKGEMVAIVGRVGSGKSTLLQAILGELYPDLSKETCLSRPEIIAYCSQVPHIGEGTLRENVLFGQELDAARYNEAIAGASLEGDLKVLPGGDGVCIGSRGITLSGGQKARVSLARAAYHKGSEVLLIDDPFGAVDAPTAMTLLNRLLLGPLMQARTRVVVLQPDSDRLRLFDRVAILDNGTIVAQGTPEDVMRTVAYKSLLSSTVRVFQQSSSAEQGAEAALALAGKAKEDNRAMRVKLREEDFEGRPTLGMVRQWCRIGRWRNILSTSLLYCVLVFLWLLSDLSLANWTNAIAIKQNVNDHDFIKACWFWISCGCFLWLICWKFGMWFTLRISRQTLDMMLTKILRAPVDKFFDKHPIGRIMNRMVTDISTVDFSLFLRSTGTIATIYNTLIPLCYIHFIMPWFITVLAIPVYYLICVMFLRYWNTTVPLRYCATNARSDVNSLIADVASNNTAIRAYGDQDRITRDMCDALDNQLKASLYGERVLRRWLMNRILFLWSFYMTTTYVVGMFSTSRIGAGTLALCIANLMLLEALLEPSLEAATGAQLEFIALARIHEYMNLPQEKPMRRESDSRFQGHLVCVPRAWLGKLKNVGQGAAIEVYRGGRQLLEAVPGGGGGLMAASGEGCTLQDLCPRCDKLRETEAWHQLIGVNEVIRDIDRMVEELCNGDSGMVMLEVQSGWLADGAQVVIENLKAGYADIPRDVLKGISVTFEPKAKVSIVGTTGCGKSSLLFVLLRLLEPRAGRVLLNGVDTRDVGLATLRSTLGLVPQDPVLFSGTLKHNLDPFGVYAESRLWHALDLTHLSGLIKGWPGMLTYQISEEGGNLSFGQRQLICLARMVLRQPPLLLLDEATSAIDPRTQEEVQKTIISAFPNSTLVAIAHRLETILEFDHVCVMERGEVIEQGNVKEVSQREGGRLRTMLEAKRVWE